MIKWKEYLSNIETLWQKSPADFKAQNAKLDADWQNEKRRDLFAREKCKVQMTNGYWHKTDRIDVSKKLGFKKQSNTVNKK